MSFHLNESVYLVHKISLNDSFKLDWSDSQVKLTGGSLTISA